MNNVHFAARRVALRLDASIGLGAPPGAALHVVSRFPTEARLARPDGASFKAGDALEFWLRPFETLMLEVSPETKATAGLPVRSISGDQAANLGVRLAMNPAALDEHMTLRFADAAKFQERGFKQKVDAYAGTLPHGNTQAAGCSWVVFKVRLNRAWSGQPLKLALHAFLPDGVEAQVETWVVKRWWEENTRPAGDGYYTDAPS